MTLVPEAEVVLSRGWWTGDGWEQRVLLRPAADVDESLFDRIDGMLPVERDTALMATLVLDGDSNAIGTARVRELSLGDRTRLLLSLRRQMFGNAMPCTLRCPACSEPMDLDLMADDLILEREAAPRLHYEDVVEVDGERLRVTFHLPTGGEVERALRSAHGATERAAKLLAQGCIDGVTKNDGASAAATFEPQEWPEALYGEVSARLEQLDPQAELRLRLSCPACGHDFEEFVDAGEYLFRELAACQRSRYQEINQLAKAYHWSEADLLKMGARKRRLYLELLAADND
jgi:hypothetical protein